MESVEPSRVREQRRPFWPAAPRRATCTRDQCCADLSGFAGAEAGVQEGHGGVVRVCRRVRGSEWRRRTQDGVGVTPATAHRGWLNGSRNHDSARLCNPRHILFKNGSGRLVVWLGGIAPQALPVAYEIWTGGSCECARQPGHGVLQHAAALAFNLVVELVHLLGVRRAEHLWWRLGTGRVLFASGLSARDAVA